MRLRVDFTEQKPIRTDPEKRNKDLYCRFHKDTGHKTDDCRQLKDEIEFLIRRGKLSKFTKDGDKNHRDNDNRGRDNDDKRTQPRGPVINVISGGPTAAGTCLLYTSPSPRDQRGSRMPSSA